MKMSLFSQLLSFCMIGVLISWILYIIFGQVTVRKLRKNPALKGKLGIEFISGYDILNVASALTAPRWFRDRFSKSQLSFFSADYQALYENTTLLDRLLGRTYWILFSTSGSAMILLVALNGLGVFDQQNPLLRVNRLILFKKSSYTHGGGIGLIVSGVAVAGFVTEKSIGCQFNYQR